MEGPKGLYVGLVIGGLFIALRYFISHICQLYFNNSELNACNIFISEFRFFVDFVNFGPDFVGYLVVFTIIILIFGIIGGFVSKIRGSNKF